MKKPALASELFSQFFEELPRFDGFGEIVIHPRFFGGAEAFSESAYRHGDDRGVLRIISRVGFVTSKSKNVWPNSAFVNTCFSGVLLAIVPFALGGPLNGFYCFFIFVTLKAVFNCIKSLSTSRNNWHFAHVFIRVILTLSAFFFIQRLLSKQGNAPLPNKKSTNLHFSDGFISRSLCPKGWSPSVTRLRARGVFKSDITFVKPYSLCYDDFHGETDSSQ
jgi:hypothetical protein